jgi:hypothetical protein
MTDRDDDGDDPLLVRPYLLGEPGGPVPQPSAQTWPEATAEPASAPGATDATVTFPVHPVQGRRARRSRRPLILLAVALLLVLGGAAGLVASWWPEAGTRTALPADVPLPDIAASEPGAAAASGAAPVGTPPTTTAASRARATTSPPTTSAPTPTTTARSSAPATRATTTPPVNLVAPPATERVGRIHGLGGLCLDLNGAVALDGTQIQVYSCNDSAAQVWTLATDGTLRIVGKCAAATDDGMVRLAGCDDRRAAQWRTGANSALVNLATEDCLTDPSAGTSSGAPVRIEDCTGAERQRWQLP